jgi:hypothetical protein
MNINQIIIDIIGCLSRKVVFLGTVFFTSLQQCLHFTASIKISSAQKGHFFISIITSDLTVSLKVILELFTVFISIVSVDLILLLLNIFSLKFIISLQILSFNLIQIAKKIKAINNQIKEKSEIKTNKNITQNIIKNQEMINLSIFI